MAKGQIFGPDDRPLGGPEENASLPVEIQAYVEAKINTAMDSARQALERDVRAERRSDNRSRRVRPRK